MSTNNINTAGWITTAEAAERLGITPIYVTVLLGSGKLVGVKQGKLWKIDPASVRDHARNHEGPDGWLTSSDTAARLGISKEYVQLLIGNGTLKTVRVGRRWFIDPEGLRAPKEVRETEEKGLRAQGWLSSDEVAEHLGISRVHFEEQWRKFRISIPVNGVRKIGWVTFYAPKAVNMLRDRWEAMALGRGLGDEQQHLVKDGWLTADALAKRLGVSNQRVRQLRDKGRFPGAMRDGWRWIYPPNAVEVLRANVSRRGPRPRSGEKVGRAAPKLSEDRQRWDALREKGWMTREEVRKHLSMTTVQGLMQRGDLVGTKVGGRWLFDPVDVEAFQAKRDCRTGTEG